MYLNQSIAQCKGVVSPFFSLGAGTPQTAIKVSENAENLCGRNAEN